MPNLNFKMTRNYPSTERQRLLELPNPIEQVWAESKSSKCSFHCPLSKIPVQPQKKSPTLLDKDAKPKMWCVSLQQPQQGEAFEKTIADSHIEL